VVKVKIAVFDSYAGKFTGDMCAWWTNHGYEVVRDTNYDPEKAQWADIIWFDTCDNNLLAATNPSQALLAAPDTKHPWSLHDMDLTGKKVIVRPIDIEVWQGHFAYDNMWNIVDDVIFLAPHIRDLMMADSRPQAGGFQTHVIPAGVDLNRWKFKQRSPGNKVGIVAERWVSKGVDYAIQLARMLPGYEFHWLGKNNDYHWETAYLEDMIKTKCPNLILEEEFVDDLDAWWEDKNYCLSVSKKEAYGYNIAEAMAKGIKPVIHRFYGATAIWPGLTWTDLTQAVDRLTEDNYNSKFYRQYLIDHRLDLESMMQSFEKVING
jgi:hypothetical protein